MIFLKKIKVILISVITFLLSQTLGNCQSVPMPSKELDTSIILNMPDSSFIRRSKVVILLKINGYVISTKYNILIKAFKNDTDNSTNENVVEFISALKKQKKQIIDVSNLTETKNIYLFLLNIYSNLMLNQNCIVYNLQNKRLEREIIANKYIKFENNIRRSAHEGIKFFAKDKFIYIYKSKDWN